MEDSKTKLRVKTSVKAGGSGPALSSRPRYIINGVLNDPVNGPVGSPIGAQH